MFLKRLELIGFKSFAQKTALDFPGGIVGIVGPNGSGKSNVIDAVRWILGEREAKNLRSAKSEDLIFAGTPERARLGMAEARLMFDNSSGFFPVDAQEVSISRQVTRDGISRYFLNKSEVRLKDIIDFFAKSRLGVKGLSIVNQGESDIFVRSSPLERRAMIEEILGLREYQLKKQEAERKLKTTTINADKVNAAVEELKPHLRLLKRQTAKWERRSEVAATLASLENQVFSFKLVEIKTGLASVQAAVTVTDDKIKNAGKVVSEREEALHKIESGQPEQLEVLKKLRAEQNALLEKRSSLHRSLSRLEAQLEFWQAQPAIDAGKIEQASLIGLLKEIRESLSADYKHSDWDKIKALFKELVGKIDKLINMNAERRGVPEMEQLKKMKDETAKELAGINASLEALAKQEGEIASSLESFNAKFKTAFRQLEDARAALSSYDAEKNKHLFERERLNMKMGDLESQISQAGRRTEEFSAIPAVALDNAFETEKTIFKLRGELAAIGEIDEALLKEAQETESRYSFLSQQHSDLQKASGDLQDLIEDLEQKIHTNFKISLVKINEEFNRYCRLMFNGGRAKLILEKPSQPQINADSEQINADNEPEIREDQLGIEVEVNLPNKKVKGLEVLSGGERSLVSIAALFALVSVSPPPFLILDEIDAALDERNTRKFSDALKEFSKRTQFVLVTHNRHTMEAANILYGVTMQSDGTSKVLSIKLEGTKEA